ncbi:glycosyltransferase domain-containing protein [Thermoactinomyces sp. DSM 45892]|uniref:glycosyltransferase domain-containing protein n=1 Tax=Thermoactinomyces sp. DSM 45892 TaxID=1882753 RepID=UPI00089506EE|nr:glycosyltransferase domain-containing protein [Thermoactinomyces sp. DSM 45892]SDZ23705.1 Protein of unknown function [Thermoactinomyces sp. DSM 45892]
MYKENKIVVYTAIMGNYETIKEIHIREPNIDYVLFTDNPNVNSATWKIIKTNRLFMDSTRFARRYKILPHRFLRQYQYSIWIDGNMVIKKPIYPLIEFLSSHPLIVFNHPNRNCIYKEQAACEALKKDTPQIMRKQIEKYKEIKYPINNGLIASGVILRQHNHPMIINLMEDWWNEVVNYSKRDQLSFNYIVWKNLMNYKQFEWNILKNFFDIKPHR